MTSGFRQRIDRLAFSLPYQGQGLRQRATLILETHPNLSQSLPPIPTL